jgi:hypothetical protein
MALLPFPFDKMGKISRIWFNDPGELEHGGTCFRCKKSSGQAVFQTPMVRRASADVGAGYNCIIGQLTAPPGLHISQFCRQHTWMICSFLINPVLAQGP